MFIHFQLQWYMFEFTGAIFVSLSLENKFVSSANETGVAWSQAMPYMYMRKS